MGSRKSTPATPEDSVATVPSSSARSVLSIWLVLHLALVAISLTAVVAASPLQVRLLNLAAVYLTPLQFGVDQRPLYLTHGSPEDQTHRVEWFREGADAWETEEVRGYRGSERQRRYSRFAKVIADAAEREETPAASLLALPLVRQAMQEAAEQELAPPARMRIVRYAPDTTRPVYPSAPIATARWEAAIVPEAPGPDGSPRWSLVTIKERRLNAEAAASPTGDAEKTSDSGAGKMDDSETDAGNS